MQRAKVFHLLVTIWMLGALPALGGQEPEHPAPAEPQAEQTAEPAGERSGPRDERKGIRPYEEVITDEAETDDGVFTVHRIENKVYYEIPASELEGEFLWVGRMSKTAPGLGYGGEKIDTRVVRWQRHGERVFLREASHEVVADTGDPISEAVRASNNEPILMAFDVAALGPNEAVVIEVTPLFETEVTELSARSRLQARGFDRRRSYVERVVSFPRNVEVRAVHTYTRPPETSSNGGSRNRRGRSGMDPGSATVELAFSMVKLPEEPMMPRLFDERVGYFSVRQTDYSRDEHRAPERRYVTRWRLEKKDPDQEISEPVRPIVYYVDPATPPRWVPWVKKGIEDWQPAFEAAGFRNAIVAAEAPSREEDPDWSPEDARYSVVRWLPSDIENAMGPHVHDPRTGEILEADIQFYHNVQNLLRNWYFVQASPLDPRARTLPLPDELMGRLLQYVVAHEVGHTLGFQHNMKASSTYPFESIRDPEWLREMSHTPTLMDYSRFNYVVQPEDGVDPEHLIPIVGPYDKWATMWGYKPIPEAATPDEERPTLDRWAIEQETTPWYRFSTDGSGSSDPGNLTEAVGDANAVEATALGLRNLERVVDILIDATAQPGRNWDELEEVYERVLGQWVRELNHVGALVGGFDSQQKHVGQEGVRFSPVPPDRQEAAVAFLNANAFETPRFLVRPEILRRIEPAGVLSRIRNSQRSVLNFLLARDRFTRLVEQQAIDGAAYGPAEFLDDLRQGIWRELEGEAVSTDAFRRNLQRLYLDVVDGRINGADAPDEMSAFLRGQLQVLEGDLERAINRAGDRPTRHHLEAVRDEISRILDPRFARSDPNAASESDGLAVPDPFDPYTVRACWIDFPVEP